MQYDERMSKNYRVTLQRYHFRSAVKCHELDVVLTFEIYLGHRPPNIVELFLTPIDNPQGGHWYSRTVVGARQLANIVKESFKEVGILQEIGSSSTVSNRSGRSTLITRMAECGVPAKVGMLISGHKSEGAYSRYDHTAETRIRAAQVCVESNKTYNEALQEENSNLKLNVIEGKENVCQPPKRVKLASASSAGGNVMAMGKQSMTVPTYTPVELQEIIEYVANYDWFAAKKSYDKGKTPVQSSVNGAMLALFGNMVNCSVNITLNGAVNFGDSEGH